MRTDFGGVDVVPLLGAVAMCYGGRGGDDQLWESGRGAFADKNCFLLFGVSFLMLTRFVGNVVDLDVFEMICQVGMTLKTMREADC